LDEARCSFQSSLTEFVDQAAKRLRSGGEPLPAMRYFYDIAARVLNPPVLDRATKEGRKLVGFYCAMVPQELIAALGAVPVRLCCGLPRTGRHGLARDCCPLVSAPEEVLSNERSSLLSEIDAVIVPAVCDWKSRFAELLSSRIPTFILRIPLNKREPSAQRERLQNLLLLIRFLEGVTARQFERPGLVESIRVYQRANYATRRLVDLMLADQPPIRGSDLLLAMNMSFFDDISSWTDAVMRLVAEAQRGQPVCDAHNTQLPRILLTGAPIIWPNWSVPETIEQAGAVIVAEELCSGARVFYDPVKIDEPTTNDILRALAERYSLACTCPCFVPNEDRVYRNMSLARRYRVDGVIYHNLRPCYLYQSEVGILRKKLDEINIPFLEIETDYSWEERERLAVRVEPFIEMLRRPEQNRR